MQTHADSTAAAKHPHQTNTGNAPRQDLPVLCVLTTTVCAVPCCVYLLLLGWGLLRCVASIRPAGKLSVLHRLLVKLHERGHRVVLFSQFTMMLGILEDYLSLAGFE